MEHPHEKPTINWHSKATLKPADGDHNIKIFTQDEINKITSNYSTPVGSGGFGQVYRGVIEDDDQVVAVKRYIRGDLIDDFEKEVSIHMRVKHKNVVRLIGYCKGESTLAMVTEYVSKGNLDDVLHNSEISISLDVRLGIAIGCAKGLRYMHSMHLSCGNLVYHGDIKPANILLDDNLTAKVSDFGLSRLLSGGNTQKTSHVKGSIDYMDPMYQREGRLTPRSDVYSFGAVLLELIARKRVKEGNVSLIGILCEPKGKQVSRELFDAKITNECNVKILEGIARLASECLSLDIYKRPKMEEVVGRLLALWRCLRGEQDIGWHKKIFSIFKKTAENKYSWIQSGLSGCVRFLTKEELNQVTQNYSVPFSWQPDVYKGTLEDNTVVVVKRYSKLSKYDNFDFEAVIRSQIVHKNIIKLLGCCLEADNPNLIYEYATKGNLSGLLNHQNDFPLELRMKVAIGTAKAIYYLHSSVTGPTIAHGNVAPSNILIDDDWNPKLTGFSRAHKMPKEPYRYPAYCVYVPSVVHRDVRSFGGVLLALIMRKDNFIADTHGRDNTARSLHIFNTDHIGREVFDEDITAQFAEAYEKNNSGRPFFDSDITAEEDIIALDELGKLALKCTKLEFTKKDRLSTLEHTKIMWQVVQNLQMIKTSWKNASNRNCSYVQLSKSIRGTHNT